MLLNGENSRAVSPNTLYVYKINEVHNLIDCEPSIAQELCDHFTFEVPGARFMPAYRNKVWDGKINYPDTFDIRDWASDLQLLQTAKASGVKSESFVKEIDKQIVNAVIDDDEKINEINKEIDSSTTAIGQFSTPAIEGVETAEE